MLSDPLVPPYNVVPLACVPESTRDDVEEDTMVRLRRFAECE